MRRAQDFGQLGEQMVSVDESDSELEIKVELKEDGSIALTSIASDGKSESNEQTFALEDEHIKNEIDLDFAEVHVGSHLTANKMKVKNNSVPKTDFPKANNISETELAILMPEIKKENSVIKIENDSESDNSKCKSYAIMSESNHISVAEIKMEDNNVNQPSEEKSCDIEIKKENCSTEIKVEKYREYENKSDFSKGRSYAIIPQNNQISVGEIKIEDLTSEEESSESEMQIPESDEETNSTKFKYEKDSDDVDMNSEDDNSSTVSKWNEEDDIPTTSRKIKKRKIKKPSEQENNLEIKSETYNDSVSDQEFMGISSDDEEEFLSDASEAEEFLSDGDENSSENQNLTVDNKPVVTQLINEYHKRPQLWFKELSSEMSDLKELQLFRSINNALRKKLNMKFSVNGVKTLLKLLCTQYEAEIERQLKDNEETTSESSTLWFYDNLFFLKDDVENTVKIKLKPSLKVLDVNILADLIDIYKNYDSLWDTNNLSFSDKKKRHETLQSMCLEIQNKMKISLSTFNLECQLLNLHKVVQREKICKYVRELEYQVYKPSPLIIKCDFLKIHQAPFQCHECKKNFGTLRTFRQHKAWHDGTPPFKCHICGIDCKTNSCFDYHSYRHKGVNYNCTICGKKSDHPLNLINHLKRVHESRTGDQLFDCNVCGKSYDRQINVKRHMNAVHKVEPVQCKICGKTCKNKVYLRSHMLRHGSNKYNCSICKKSFKRSNRLNEHMAAIHSLNCKNCGEACSNKKSLIQHMSSHHNTDFNCDICGTGFWNENRLEIHIKNSHTDEGIRCEICNKVFKNDRSLKNHSLSHIVKKYDCNVCEKVFTNQQNLKRHMCTHNKKFECTFCGNKYAQRRVLQHHVRVCNYAHSYVLKTHVKMCKKRDI